MVKQDCSSKVTVLFTLSFTPLSLPPSPLPSPPSSLPFLSSLPPQTLQELKHENQRMKDENSALIRVIGKLSRSPLPQSHT